MKAFAYHFSFEFFTGLRNKTLLLMMYLLPLGFHFMMGLMMVDINPLFLETMIPAMVIFAILSGMILGLPQPLVEAREAGIFRSYKINGVPALSIIVIPALSAFIHAVITSVIIVVTGSLIFDAPLPVNWPAFLLVFLVFAFTCSGLGVLIGVISSSSRVTVLWSQLIYLPSMMAGGLFVPSQMLPEVLARAARLLPTSYAMDAFKDMTLEMPAAYPPYWAVLILLAAGILAFGLALYLFSWDSKNTTRRSPLLALLVLLPFILGMILLPLGERMELFGMTAGAVPGTAYANSTPVVMEEEPTFSITPMESTTVSVTSQRLTFEMSSESPGLNEAAKVTASYVMKNESGEEVQQVMLFPFITSYYKGFLNSVIITAGGKSLDYKTFRLQDIPQEFLYSGEKQPTTITVNQMIERLNRTEYIPKNYTLDQVVTVHTLQLPKGKESYQSEVSFRINLDEQIICYYNFNGFTYDKDGSGILSTWAAPDSTGTTVENAYIVVLGENYDNAAEIKSTTGHVITSEEQTLGEFLKRNLIKDSLREYPIDDAEQFGAYLIEQLDILLERDLPFLALDDNLVVPYIHNTFAGAFLYTVPFKAHGSMAVIVEYKMQPTVDRSRTIDYTDIYQYMLHPAEGWKDFQNLTIEVIPGKKKPYLVESSLPLVKDDDTGIFKGQFKSLPEEDFSFTMYKSRNMEPPLIISLSNALYMLPFFLAALFYILLFVGGIAVIVFLIIRRVKQP